MTQPITNKIVTCGLGPLRGEPGRSGLITSGFGGTLSTVVAVVQDAVTRIDRVGGRRTERRVDVLSDIYVWAKLIEVNGRAAPPPRVAGAVRARTSNPVRAVTIVEHVSTRTREAWETIKVAVERLK